MRSPPHLPPFPPRQLLGLTQGPCPDCGMYTVYLSAFNYLAEAYTLYASSALSAMSFVRNCVGAVFPRASLSRSPALPLSAPD